MRISNIAHEAHFIKVGFWQVKIHDLPAFSSLQSTNVLFTFAVRFLNSDIVFEQLLFVVSAAEIKSFIHKSLKVDGSLPVNHKVTTCHIYWL